jgi:two-component system chemotaxis response regulator CheY
VLTVGGAAGTLGGRGCDATAKMTSFVDSLRLPRTALPLTNAMTASAHTVMVVEDEGDIREALAEILTDEGYTVVTAQDGQIALDLLAIGVKPNVILTDLMMPRLNGLELIKILHAAKHVPIPIVVVSANRGYDADDLGVAAVLRKPVDLAGLLATIKQTAG